MKGTGGFLQPEEIIKQLNINEDAIVADFGCGAGYFSIPLAKIVKEGKVFALDILDTALQSVQSQTKIEGILNIETKLADLEAEKGSGLEKDSIDLVLLANILFQSPKKDDIIKEAERILKKNGTLVIIDWKSNQLIGPPKDLIVSQDSIKKTVEDLGLKFNKEVPIDKYHWGMTFVK